MKFKIDPGVKGYAGGDDRVFKWECGKTFRDKEQLGLHLSSVADYKYKEDGGIFVIRDLSRPYIASDPITSKELDRIETVLGYLEKETNGMKNPPNLRRFWDTLAATREKLKSATTQ